MAEYMAFIRGVIIVVIQMWKAGVNFMFKHLLEQEQNDLLKPHIDKVTLPEGSKYRSSPFTAPLLLYCGPFQNASL